MASEEQINNQQRLNDLRQEELSYIQESEEFLASTISKSAQLADTIKSQLASIREKTTLDQKVLQFSKQNVDVLSKLKVDYQDITKVDKDRKGILDQIQKNNNIINAQGQDLSKEVKEQAKAFVEQEKALSDQQKILAEKIDKQEQIARIIKAQEAAGKKVDMADKALLKNAQESTRLQQMKVAGIQAEVLEAGRVADPLAVSLALLQDQNAQLDEAVGYLDDEEEAIINVEKAQGLFNISLGAAGKLLKKAGLESSALYLGLGKGAEAAEEAANRLTEGGTRASTFGDRIKVLGAGIAGTFKGMANEIKAIGIGALLFKGIKGAFNMLGGKVITGFLSDLKSKFTSGISYLKDQFFSLNSYIEDAKAGDAFNQRMSKATADIATNLGVSTKNAKELVAQAGKVSASVGMLPEELAATTAELQKSFGSTQKFSTDTVKTMGQLTNLLGLSNEEASEFVKLSQLSGEEASDTTLTYKTQIQALKERENIAISEKEIMKEIAKSSAAQQLTFRASGKSLAEAAFHAKKMGLSLAQTEAIGSNLLDFESSIANEMEAELLLGKDLNLERARSAALEGDLATVAKEVAGQIGSAAEFGKMNVIQQEALAKSVGVSRDELANMLKTQELLAGTGFDDMNDAQAQFKKLLKETGSEEAALAKMKEMGASDALQAQLRGISLEEKRAQQQRNIEAAQGKIANAVNKVFDAFAKVEKIIKNIKAVIVQQMKPFFDQFGGLVSDGGSAFEKKVLPYAKQLGKFMNDVGIRLTEIVRDNGPQIGKIFTGLLEMFGAIYEVVGKVVKRLLGIQDVGASSQGFFANMGDTISSITEKLKNLDISAVTNKVKAFIDKIKGIFDFIVEKINLLGSFLGKNPGLTKAAGVGMLAMKVAPNTTKSIVGGALKGIGGLLAGKLGMKKGQSKSAPLYVEDVSGGAGGGLMDMVGKMGGRKAGIGGGFKQGFKGLMDYAKMAMKGGRAGKVGRARLLRAGKGLITGQGASFVGGTGKGAAQAAGKLGGIAGKLGSVGKGLGKLAAGGGIGAVVGLAAEATLGVFEGKARKAAESLETQIMATSDATKEKELDAKKEKKLRQAEALSVAGTTAKYAGLGATIGSVIPGVGTAVGAAVGAVAGFTVGMVKANKERKYRQSEAYKLEQKHQRNMQRIAKRTASIEMMEQAQMLAAKKEAIEKENELLAEYGNALGVSGDLQSANIDHTSAAFKKLAEDALNAGQITEEQFAGALKGTIPAAELLKTAATNAGLKIQNMTSAVIDAAAAIGKKEEERILEEAGVNADLVRIQQEQLQLLTDRRSTNALDIETQFGDDLFAGLNTDASELLAGTDSDSEGALKAIREQYLQSGLDESIIDQAIQDAASYYALNDIEAGGNIEEILGKIDEFAGMAITDKTNEAKAAGLAKQQEAATTVFESGGKGALESLTKEQVLASKETQDSLKDLGVDIDALIKDGKIETAAFNDAILNAQTEMTNLAAEDTAKFNSIVDVLKAQQKMALMEKADAAKAAGNEELYTKLMGEAEELNDFILRPGQPPLKFNKDDLVIGGTSLEGDSSSSEETSALKQELQEMKQMMATFVEQVGQVINRPIVLEMNGNKVGQALGQDSYRIQ